MGFHNFPECRNFVENFALSLLKKMLINFFFKGLTSYKEKNLDEVKKNSIIVEIF